MKSVSFFLVVTALLCATTFADDEANLNRVLGSLNARANMPNGKNYVMAVVSRETKVPIKTLAMEQSQTGFGFGELFAAHTVAAASGKSFQEIATLRLKQRKNWSQMSQQLNVDIGMVTKKARHADMAVDLAYGRSTNRPHSNTMMLRDAGFDRQPAVPSGM
jgi:hypothetical protein